MKNICRWMVVMVEQQGECMQEVIVISLKVSLLFRSNSFSWF